MFFVVVFRRRIKIKSFSIIFGWWFDIIIMIINNNNRKKTYTWCSLIIPFHNTCMRNHIPTWKKLFIFVLYSVLSSYNCSLLFSLSLKIKHVLYLQHTLPTYTDILYKLFFYFHVYNSYPRSIFIFLDIELEIFFKMSSLYVHTYLFE